MYLIVLLHIRSMLLALIWPLPLIHQICCISTSQSFWLWLYVQLKGKGRYILLPVNPISELGDVTYHMGSQCYLPPDRSERAPPNSSHAGWYSKYLPRRVGRMSWPSWLDSAPAGNRTSDLSITSPTPNRCTTKTDVLLTWQKNLSSVWCRLLTSLVAVSWRHIYSTCCNAVSVTRCYC